MGHSHETIDVNRKHQLSRSWHMRLASVVTTVALSAIGFAAFTAGASADNSLSGSEGKNLGLVVVDDSLNGNDVLSNNAVNACVIAKCEAESKEVTVNGGGSDEGKNLGLVVVDDSLNGNDVLSNNAVNACVIAKCEAESKEFTLNSGGSGGDGGSTEPVTTTPPGGGGNSGGTDPNDSTPPVNGSTGSSATSDTGGITPPGRSTLITNVTGSVDRMAAVQAARGSGGTPVAPNRQTPMPAVLGAQAGAFTPPLTGNGGLVGDSSGSSWAELILLLSIAVGLASSRRSAVMRN